MNTMKNIYRKTILTGAIGLFLGGIFSCSEEEPLNMAPTFQINEVDIVFRTSAVVSGKISGDIAHIKEYGFDYSESEDFTSNLTTRIKVGESLNSNSYQLEIKGLEANERYYYRMYASTGASTVYSDSKNFLTVASQAPVMSELVVDSIGEDMARFRCTIEEIGDEYLIEYGVGYKTAAERTYYQVPSDSIIPVSMAGVENTFYIEITGLEPATKYSFRPYAKNSSDANGDTGTREGYGTILEQQTENQLSAEVVTEEIMVGNVGINSVTVSGKILSAVGSNGVVDVCGFCWSATNQTPSILDNHMEMNSVPKLGENFTGVITGLQTSTTYYVRAYAKNTVNGAERIGYGAVYEITTTNLVTPSLEWSTVKDEWGNSSYYEQVTSSSISVRATIKNYDESALVEKGLIWSQSNGQISIQDARKNNTYLIVENGQNVIDGTIKGLEMNSSYYVRGYAIYRAAGIEEIGYTRDVRSIRTEGFQLPYLDDVEVPQEEITRNSAKLIGKISSTGNGNITERGFCLSLGSKTEEPTITNCDIHIKSDEKFVSVAKNLKYDTRYVVRAYVISKLEDQVDTTYNHWRSEFWTKGLVFPIFNHVMIDEEKRTHSSISVSSKIVTLGDGKLVEKGFIWKEEDWPTMENALGVLKVETDSLAATITNLRPNALYYVKAYAKVNIDDKEYVCYSSGVEVRVNDVTRPETDFDWNNMTSTLTSLTVAVKINSLKQGKIVEQGVVWNVSTNANPWPETNMENHVGKVVNKEITNEAFSVTIPDLLPNSRYVVTPYMKIKVDDYEYIHLVWSTLCTTSSIEMNLGFEETSDTSVKLVGYKSEDLPDGVTEYGFCWSEDENVNVKDMSNQVKASEPNAEGEFRATITGLTMGKRYYVGMYIVYKNKKYYADGRWDFATKQLPGINDNTSPDKKD